jgi:hypothetical protein
VLCKSCAGAYRTCAAPHHPVSLSPMSDRKARKPHPASIRAEAKRLAKGGMPAIAIAEQLGVHRATLARWAVKTEKHSLAAVEKAVRHDVQQHPGLSHLVGQAVRTIEHLSGAGERAAAALSACEFMPFKIDTPRAMHEFARAWDMFLLGTRRQLGLDQPGQPGQPVSVHVLFPCRSQAQSRQEMVEPVEIVDVESVSATTPTG